MRKRYIRKNMNSYICLGLLLTLILIMTAGIVVKLVRLGANHSVEVQAAYVTTQEEIAAPQDVQQDEGFLKRLIAMLPDPMSIITSQFPSVRGVEIDAPVFVAQELEEHTPDPDASEEIKIQINNIKNEVAQPIITVEGEPSILIYHTHFSEAYDMSGGAYDQTETYRTHDTQHNIVKVGEALAQQLREHGYNVIHDQTNHEPPKLGTSYNRSLKTMKDYKEKYPSIQVFIDVHRDAFIQNSSQAQTAFGSSGESLARLMFVVGTGEGDNGNVYSEIPNWQENYKLANGVTEKLNEYASGLAKNVVVKKGRYNQHVSDRCLLLEVGNNRDTLDEALRTIPYAARAIDAVLKGK